MTELVTKLARETAIMRRKPANQQELDQQTAVRQAIADLCCAINNVRPDMKGTIPVVLPSRGLYIARPGYATPITMAEAEFEAAFGRAASFNPVEELITDDAVGPATINLSLPGFPGVATGDDRFVLVAMLLLTFDTTQQIAKGNFTFSITGVSENGQPVSVPPTQISWQPGAGDNQTVIVILCQNNDLGPVPSPLRMTTVDFPGQLLNNGAPNAAAGDTINVTLNSGVATMPWTATAITVGHDLYNAAKTAFQKSVALR
jgi:hypothetical protein